ncbi:hypothetical protein [Aurantimonas sp. Leaf443]|uniref:hypothetical protein n=1 Tax=Aurantimonas sp. Leaf443 TaxID=1736378 RepID=UPI000ADB2DB1|nr:hypothetical protein [Aurantimonas sp. Leaf443]
MNALTPHRAWEQIEVNGWHAGHGLLSTAFPMPGEPHFADDELFVDVALFPRAYTGEVIKVGDDVWEFPRSWFRQLEARPRSLFHVKFRLKCDGVDTAAISAAKLAVKRAMYLEIVKSRRPLGLSSFRTRVRIYEAFALVALRNRKPLTSLDAVDLLEAVNLIDKSTRRVLPAVYDLLRWWKGLAPDTFSMFEPPVSIGYYDRQADIDEPEDDFRHGGLDTENIREEVEDGAAEPITYAPLPDDFVAAAGGFCLQVLKELAPTLDACMRELDTVDASERSAAVGRIAARYDWPTGMEVRNPRSLRSVGALCQLALLFILSLLLGFRWSEIQALPRTVLLKRGDGEGAEYFLDGNAFKFEQSTGGTPRDWPISPEIASYVERQARYIELTEGAGFAHLWRNHRYAWGGGEPLRQIDKVLKTFAQRHGFEHHLGGTSCHHHRFRKTTARLIVVALNGGPFVLRRLFGHQTLAMTLIYILADRTLVEELRQIAVEEQASVAARLVERRDNQRGGGADQLRAGIANVVKQIQIMVPQGSKAQERVSTEQIVELATVDAGGLVPKQILPGLVHCLIQRGEAGKCCRKDELPNIARCDSTCRWHVVDDEFIGQARVNVADALSNLVGAAVDGPKWRYYSDVVIQRAADFPELEVEFEENAVFRQLTGRKDANG